ncbi:hypothetical protein RJ640_019246 [Escallonia rubra]|uniref:Choline monooxygenase, chloroplastic n=1 Tax=Escallonia rubra TaxID=112253 RepID=A0AA88R5V6_9ASTE|nr:hypothetical protein RJ640_019246 [Escallonia rubra]
MATMMMPMPRPLCFHLSETVVSTRSTDKHQPPRSCTQKQPRFLSQTANSCKSNHSSSPPQSTTLDQARSLVDDFNPKIPIEQALTPPTSWYTDPTFFSLELDRVFYRGWQAVGYTDQVKEARDYFTGRLANVEYVVCRDDNGKLQAFHNVCRHHASVLASGCGKRSCFVCPYHSDSAMPIGSMRGATKGKVNKTGLPTLPTEARVVWFDPGWTYGLEGKLLKATRITGIQNFNVDEFGLLPLEVAIWGPFVLLNLERDTVPQQESQNLVGDQWLGSSMGVLNANGVDSSLNFVCRREYTIECNWKVFCDNYLDGGYHVPYAHKGLASGLTLESYSTTMYEKVSIQRCDVGQGETQEDFDRLGSKALYAFIYPNFMINRYGPWMDTNLVLPLGHRKCQVIFDYFVDASLTDDDAFIESSLKESEKVQMEDIVLCEAVQRGLESPAYCTGRYAPTVEKAMHHFHCLLHENLAS